MHYARFSLLGISLLFAAACTTTPVTLGYQAPPTVRSASKADVELATVTDHRKNGPNWLGAIRGGFGNPLKTLETPIPVKDVVGNAFTDGLKARSMKATGSGRFGLQVDVNQFDCNQYVRREAHAKFQVTVLDRGTGKPIYTKNVVVDHVESNPNPFDAGILASTEDLQHVADLALREAVDQALDDPELIAAIL